MIPMEEAVRIIRENTSTLPVRRADLEGGSGLVLAEDVKSDIDIPPFDKAAMDGYAVRADDIPAPRSSLKPIDTIPAGSSMGKVYTVGPRECIRIMTGAPVPPGADTVVMFEETEENGDEVLFGKVPVKGQNICRRGEDAKSGSVVLSAGTRIAEPEIAALASVGKIRIRVFKRPEVGVLVTGNEIVTADKTPGPGSIRDANGPLLGSLLRSSGCDVARLGIGRDSREVLREHIERGLRYDFLLVSGGVSAGDFDLVPSVLEELGAVIHFHKVRVKPGKPLLFAERGECRIFGIPGNPVSNLVGFHLFIKPAIRKCMGIKDHGPEFQDAVIERDFERKGKRTLIVPSICDFSGTYRVRPLILNGSADIIGCSGCTCFTIIDGPERTVKKGEVVKILPI